MKTCPVCGARCFDDMAVCYGCLHDFSRALCSAKEGASRESDRLLPCLDGAFDTDDIDEPVHAGRSIGGQQAACSASERIAFDPPWFASAYAVDSSDGKALDRSEAGAMRMAVPMVTVVRREDALPAQACTESHASSFLVSIPKGGSVMLCAR